MPTADQSGDGGPCVTLEEAARLLKRSVRAFERRHHWSPPFPDPISSRPLVWRREDVLDWIGGASRANARSRTSTVHTPRSPRIDIVGKDWLTVEESAHYCGVSVRQFVEKAGEYRLEVRNFMGRKLYKKVDLFAAIDGAAAWPSDGSWLADQSAIRPGGFVQNLAPVKRKRR